MPDSRRWYLIAAAIMFAGAILTMNRLGDADVCGFNEAVEGLVVQQMVEHGALLFPTLNDREPAYKPPLFHWTAIALDHLLRFGKVTAFNLRLPSALYAIAGVLLTMFFARWALGDNRALLAGLMLVASYQYVSEGRIGRVDMTLTFVETLSLMAFLWWLGSGATEGNVEREERWLYLFAFALGLGVLAKGPVGAILPVLAVVIFLLVERQFDAMRRMLSPGPIILALLVGSSWYVACLAADRYGFLNRQLGSENFGRFFGTLGAMPPWYYVKPILLNSVPLSLAVPIAVVAALRDRAVTNETSAAESETQRFREHSSIRLFAIFWIVTVVFFSIAAYKRRAYLLPLWPASAVILAWWAGTLKRCRGLRYSLPALALACIGLVIFNLIYLPAHERKACAGSSFPAAAASITRVVGRQEPLFVYGTVEKIEPLLFYLDRDVTPIRGSLDDAPPGYVLISEKAWNKHRHESLELEPLLAVKTEPNIILLLLRHGKVYASR
jgi:4-amino-4-deoxy-L-arabinose transferase-like glycosyltransferase